MRKTNHFKLIISILVCLAAGFIGSLFTANSVKTWYLTIEKPIFNPPSFVFAPVWTILYILMGISLYLVWEKGFKDKVGLWLFIAQLVLNTLWSIIFFDMHAIGLALIEILLLWACILALIIVWWKNNRASSYLLLPYIIWVSFATVLNFSIWLLN